MGVIQVLDPHVVNQIAAGEVVERPASVVKELVENALDAGASQVAIRVEEGGRKLIEVTDNGAGMTADDLERAFLPHATSKVASVEDLTHVATMGFRGEALASIGSVAHVSITSRRHDDESAWAVENHDGRLESVRPAAGPPGTSVRVVHLFGNVPARRKFMRTPTTEAGHVHDLISRFALAFPHVGFRLEDERRVRIRCDADQTRHQRIDALHGSEVAGALLEVHDDSEAPEVTAFVGPPALTRRDGRLEQVFLNGRHIRDRTIAHAVREAYRDLIPPGGHRPIAFVFLACDPAAVDVNVHPQKTEVRWRDSGAAHRVVRRALRRALQAASPGARVPAARFGPVGDAGPARESTPFAFGAPMPAAPPSPFVGSSPAGGALLREGSAGLGVPEPNTTPGHCAPSNEATESPRTAAGLRPVGQALGTYLVLEDGDSIVLVDQHALHERVLFDQINTRLREKGRLEVQRLLIPTVVHLAAADRSRLLEESELLASLGWEVEAFGEDALAVQAVPAVLRRPDPEAALRDVLGILERGAKDGLDRATLLSEAIDSLACRSAVMAGDALHADEVLALLAQAEALDHQHSCPHGRPTRLTMSKAQLERWFHRTV